jgi:glycosyltransferase involved in cell wall biosynthesis
VFVLPSLREAGGAVVLEAMATALPVIVADRGGPAEIVDDASGIRVDATSRKGYVEGLTQAMVRLATDSDQRRAMGRAGRRRVEENYAWAVLASRLIEIYEDVVSESA